MRISDLSSDVCSSDLRVRVDDWILVHDAARPCLSAELLQHLLDAVQHDPVGGLLAIPLADPLKRADHEQRVSCTEQRDGLWLAQTPQKYGRASCRERLCQTVKIPVVSVNLKKK